MFEHLPGLLCLKDKAGCWLWASAEYLASFNLLGVDYFGKTDNQLAEIAHADQLSLQLNVIQDKSAWHLAQPLTETRIVSDRDNRKLQITRTPVFDAKGKPWQLIITGYFADLPTQKAPQTIESDAFSYAFQASHLGFAFLDKNFRITRINEAFSSLTGYLFDEVTNQYLSFIVEGDFAASPRVVHSHDEDRVLLQELTCHHKEGHTFPIKLDITQITLGNQEVSYFACLFDITRQKQSEKRIMQIAHYDDLTGLVNRTMFFDRLSQALSASKRHHLHMVIFFLDLDRFKTVNDSLGHDAGDQLLKETAERLIGIMRKEDVVARLSGDEFAMLLLNEKAHEQAIYSASMIAEKIIQTLSEPFYIQRREVFIGASIGISIFPEDGSSSEVLLKHADIAMYEAKKQGRNNYQFFKKDYTTASQDRLSMELSLRKALEKHELSLYYQPQYRAISRELVGAEVLIRWFNGSGKDSKMIPPYQFIGIAEETGLIIEIGEWILRTACLQMKAWLEEGYFLHQVSVNVSARQFNDDNFLATVEDALKEADLEAHFLELEITESMLMGDVKQVELQLQRLKKMGIKIALDDFGTGYSSLSYLKNFPIDVLKIDQSFIREMTLDSKDARIVCAIIEMGHSLGQKIVAEGVETEQQLIYLSHRGCDIIQGYYFSKPLPENKMTSLLSVEAENIAANKRGNKNQDNLNF